MTTVDETIQKSSGPSSSDDTIPVKAEYKKQEEENPECPECGNEKFEKDSAKGELFCKNCGSIIDEDMIDTTQEWRAFNAQERQKKSRAGSSVTYTKSDKGFKTKIGKGGEINKVSADRRSKYYRMKKWDRRLESSDKSLDTALKNLQSLVSQLELPESVFEEAARITEKAKEEEIIKGRGNEPTVAGVTYLIARKQQVPRTLDEIAEAAGLDKREVGKAYRQVSRELELEVNPALPEHFIPRYGERLGFNGKEQARARQMIKKSREKGVIAGRSPKSVVAGAFYIVSSLNDKDLTQKQIAEEIGVTEVTVRKSYTEISEKLEIEI